jgi:hypothetical protein
LTRVEDSVYDEYRESIVKAFDSKRGVDVSNVKSLLPGISAGGGTVFLPDTINRDNNNIVRAMAVLAKDLGSDVQLIPYGERRFEELSRDMFKYSSGVSFVVLDYKRKLNIKSKSDAYEEGRTYARSQQVIGGFTKTSWLGLDALRRSHKWFGNNPNEFEGSGRSRHPVAYQAKGVANLFCEIEWAESLGSLLNQLLHRSWVLLDEEIQRSALAENIRPYSDCVSAFMERTIVITPAVGRKPATTRRRVPKLPRENPLMTKNEITLLGEISVSAFKFPSPSNNEEWLANIETHTWKNVRATMEGQAIARDEVLTRFAALTTKRLQQVRKHSSGGGSRRKADIKSEELNAWLCERDDPYGSLAAELATLDPAQRHIFKKIGESDKGSKSVLKGTSGHLRSTLRQIAIDFKVYSELEFKKPETTTPLGSSSSSSFTPPSGSGSSSEILDEVNKITALTSSEDIRVLINRCYKNGLFDKVDQVASLNSILSKLWKSKEFSNLKNNSDRKAAADEVIKKWIAKGKPLGGSL